MIVIFLKILNRIGKKYIIFKKIKDKIIFKFIEKYYEKAKEISTKNVHTKTEKINIWIFWAQGYENAPILIKRCIDRIKMFSNGYEVKQLDINNIKEFIDLPNIIYERLSKKTISLAHFSDVLRISLIAKYGGVWIDPTVFVGEDFSQIIKQGENFITIKQENIKDNISMGMWSTWLIGTKKISTYFEEFRNFYILYFQKNKRVLDYFLTDYLFAYSYINNEEFRNDVNKCPTTKYQVYSLINKRDNECTIEEFNEFIKKNQINKLSHKIKYNIQNKKTYASHMFN